MRVTRLALTLAALALGAAACGSTVVPTSDRVVGAGELGTGPSGQLPANPGSLPAGPAASVLPAGPNGGASSGPAAVTPSGAVAPGQAPGVVTTGPIKVGFFAVDWTKAVSAVAGTSSSAPPVIDIWKTWVAIVNATGGLAGRKVVPTYYSLDATQPNWTTSIEAACATFGQDNHVAFVASYADPSDLLANCLLPYRIADVSASGYITDGKTLAALPNYFLPVQPRMERYTASVIRTAVSRGWLTTKDRLGVLLADCPQDTRVYDDTIVPLAKQYGFAVENDASISCPQGFAGAGGIASGTQNAELSFRTHGVTQVMYLTPTTNYVNELFANDADSQGWTPGYLLDSSALLQLSSSLIPSRQLANMRGAGWAPVDDLQRATSPATSACEKVAQSAHVSRQQYMEEGASSFYYTCDVMTFLRDAMQISRGGATLGDLTAATRGLGTRLVSASDFGPTDFSGGQRDGTARTAPYAWIGSCQCVRYLDQPSPMPW